jgi:hypothetical protein
VETKSQKDLNIIEKEKDTLHYNDVGSNLNSQFFNNQPAKIRTQNSLSTYRVESNRNKLFPLIYMQTFHTERPCRRHNPPELRTNCFYCRRKSQLESLLKTKISPEEILLRSIFGEGGRFFSVITTPKKKVLTASYNDV